jgi:hypothetical protein
VVILYVSGQCIGPIFKGQEDGTDTLSLTVGKGLQFDPEERRYNQIRLFPYNISLFVFVV